MKSSAFLVAACALLATASPVGKRAVEIELVRQTVTVTVTCDENGPTGAAYVQPLPETTTSTLDESSAPQSTVQAPPSSPPAPESTTTVPAPPYSSPAPESTTTVPAPPSSSPAPVSTTTVQAPPSTTSAPAPQTTTQAPSSQPPAPQPTTTILTPVVEKESSSAPQPTQSSSSDDYQSSMLYQHNIHRANHSAAALTWDDTLADYAVTIANTCVFAHVMDEGSGGYGQNLASWGSTSDISDLQIQAGTGGVTDQWYNSEMGNWLWYGQSNPPSGSDLDSYGHFTQVTWNSTSTVGCATVMCAAGTVLTMQSWYTVCNYGPPGNYGGQYGTNVLPPLGQPMVTV